MKHRHLRWALAALLAAGTAGCKDVLREDPVDFVGPENFYRNATDALAAVNASYAALVWAPSGATWAGASADDYYGRNMYMIPEYMTEAMTSRFSTGNERGQFDVFQFGSNHAYLQGTWFAIYHAINRANAVVGHVPQIDMDTALRTRIVGEAKFLRALHYFNLARMWGNVPLKLTETSSLDSLQIPQASEAEVYEAIISDLQDAIAALPLRSGYTTTDLGRATKGAAQTLLGKVYLQRGATGVGTAADFAAAEAQLRAVIASGQYLLDPNYGSLFDGTNEASKEIIFDIQNIRAENRGGRLMSHIGPARTGFNGTNNSFQVEFPFFNSYASTDKRRDASWLMSYTRKDGTVATWSFTATNPANSYGSTGPVPRKFWDPQTAGTGMDEPNYPLLRYADVLLMLAEAINEQAGPTGEAVGFVNQVRARAGLAALGSADIASKAAFRDAIFRERRWELVFEGHGFFDSQRNWAWAKARVEANMKAGLTVANGGSNANKSPFTSAVPKAFTEITDKFRHFPIPDRAIELNPLLKQNPGW
ncbi:MAG TPA: RagB/SusD family nutrient uptake outer membrane protein [Longimicrobiaceae bacterium]